MSSVRAISIGLALAAAAMASAAQAGVVVKSSGPSAGQYPPGKKLDDDARITLKAGDSVTVLTGGGTRVISGAGTHRVGARGASKRSTFAVLTRQRSSQRVRTGAVRAPDGVMAMLRSPNLWYVDVSQSGTVCVANPDAVRLWRPGTEGNATYVLASATSPDHVHVAFADGEMDTGWNTDQMPLAEGASYTIMGPDGASASEVTFTMLDDPAVDAEGLAEQLIGKGCMVQLELLTSAMS